MVSAKARIDAPLAVLVWAAVALAANGIWFNLVGYSPAFASGNGAIDTASPGRLGFLFSTMVCFLALAVLDRKTASIRHMLALTIPVLLLMGTGMFGIAASQTLIAPETLLLAGSVLMGLGYAWNTLCIYALFATNGSLWRVVLVFAGTGAVGTILNAAVLALVAPAGQMAIASFMVIVVPICLYLACRTADRSGIDPGSCYPLGLSKKAASAKRADSRKGANGKSGPAKSLLSSSSADRRQMLLLGVITIAMIAMRGLGTGGIWGGQRDEGVALFGWTLLAVAIYLCLSLVTFRVHLARPRQRRYHLPFLVLIAGFLLITALNDTGSPIRGALGTSIELFCQLIFSYTIVSSIRMLPYSAFVVTGITTAFSWALAILWMVLFEHADPTASLIILMVSYLLIVFVATPREGEATADAGGNPFEAVIAQSRRLGEERGLTKRESEILELVAQGRSVPYICEELTLADGTVRTHMMRIYKKLDVHSKQELLDLLAGKT